MASKVPSPKGFLYGGDYNPEQWLDRPDILAEDIRLMKQAGINTVSLGIFSWSTLEPEDGVYDFGFLEERINTLYENGIYTILATPSGSRPKWLADKYPEVLRVDDRGVRQHYGFRHNHCMTSPALRKKIYAIDRKLSETFGNHPGVISWHINNEMSGPCYCPLCQDAFRDFLKRKYGDIKNVNHAWSTTFWSHTYRSFEEIEAPSSIGETQLHGLNLDWMRFVTERHKDFTAHEIQAVRDGGSNLPVTMNLMYNYTGLDYQEFSDLMDYMSWDNYPTWHKGSEVAVGFDSAFEHDRIRSIQRAPYLMMESCPSSTNWQSVSKLKAPGILEAQQIQAIAHGSEGALYFQIRQSRGASEKFHGAVIDHYGGEDTRVFREVAKTGHALESIREVLGSTVHSPVAVIYDTQNRWALEDAQGPRNAGLYYREAVEKSYLAFKKYGLNVDLIDETQSLDQYQVIAVPMAYMFRQGFEKKLRDFVANGGRLILSYWSGIVDDTDLCFLGGTPHGFIDVCGFRSKEIDGLYEDEIHSASSVDSREERHYNFHNLAELLELEGAEALYTYDQDWYQGQAAVTRHTYEKGVVFGLAADFDQDFYDDFYEKILKEISCKPILGQAGSFVLPTGVEVSERTQEDGSIYIFLINWNREAVEIPVDSDCEILYASGDSSLMGQFQGEAGVKGTDSLGDKYLLHSYECLILKK